MTLKAKLVKFFNQGKNVTECSLWKCPKCGFIQVKGALLGGLKPGTPRSELEGGQGSCIKCHIYFPLVDIYCGKYDTE